jgi:hypothetical protein
MPGSLSFISKNGKKVVIKICNDSIYINDILITREELIYSDGHLIDDIEITPDQFNSMACYISSQLNFAVAY